MTRAPLLSFATLVVMALAAAPAGAVDGGSGMPAPDPLGGVTRFLAPDAAAPRAAAAPAPRSAATHGTRTAAKPSTTTRTAQAAHPSRGPAVASTAPPLGWRAPPVPPPPYYAPYRPGPRYAWAPPPMVVYPAPYPYAVPYAVPYPAWRYPYPYGYAVVPRAYVRVW